MNKWFFLGPVVGALAMYLLTCFFLWEWFDIRELGKAGRALLIWGAVTGFALAAAWPGRLRDGR